MIKQCFINQLNSVINKSINIEEKANQQMEYIKQNYLMSKIIKKPAVFEWAN